MLNCEKSTKRLRFETSKPIPDSKPTNHSRTYSSKQNPEKKTEDPEYGIIAEVLK